MVQAIASASQEMTDELVSRSRQEDLSSAGERSLQPPGDSEDG
jgi:hypothetical protein